MTLAEDRVTDPEVPETDALDEGDVEDLLIEEVSIDGMCGVY
ncbi:MAG: mycofactocin precursor MftA [Acidimicrobiales bacterium]